MSAHRPETVNVLRPATVCEQLLLALDASDGRRARRKRNTTPGAIGQGIKRALLEQAIAADPDPDGFDTWLLARCQAAGAARGPVRAMARDILAEWYDVLALADFRAWLDAGAPSDDRCRPDSRRAKGT